ncbi:hypothetical protein, variant [Verruconis gallopava]|uniref:INO80 complex subunit B-like conserved region domain-containing protein n=1 Tax=Verruconis gallopava TaxID=253628 RepID=A0A0D2AIJ5_9PEZI|nr:hypothetical protein, variant [Verruconis gallopava]KIW06375.1 hypothetical protein, variant [Verruconis gallopava]
MSRRPRVDSSDLSASPAPAVSTRPRRGTVNRAPPTTIERSSPDETRVSSIRLTVKADPKKLKEATSGGATPSKRQVGANSRDSFVGGGIVTGTRSTRKKAIVESESEEDEEEDEEEVEQEDFDEEEDAEGEEDEDAEGEEDEDEEMADEDEDAEGDEDEVMVDAPAVTSKGRAVPKPQVTVTPALPSVEDKEMAMDDDEDEELSDLSDEELEGGEDGLGADAGEDDDDDSDEDISRSQTPDPSKLTRRQRQEAVGLMALSNEAQKKKHFTAEEISMRRAEMARRRKALSEKRNDEEKQDTINRLLKRQASKRQRKADVEADRIAEEGEDETVKPNKLYTRYIQNTHGVVLGVPQEWVDAGYVGGVFGKDGVKGASVKWTGRMVEVID